MDVGLNSALKKLPILDYRLFLIIFLILISSQIMDCPGFNPTISHDLNVMKKSVQ